MQSRKSVKPGIGAGAGQLSAKDHPDVHLPGEEEEEKPLKDGRDDDFEDPGPMGDEFPLQLVNRAHM